jgi:pilus assembly protein CpaC
MRLLSPLSCRLLLLALIVLAPLPQAHAANKAPAAPTVLSLSVDHGIPLTLSAPAASVFIANPDVADVQVVSPTSVMVFGKKMGQTTLLATDNNGRTLLHRTIVVTQDLSDLRQALKTVIPNNKIGVEAVPGGIVLTGEAKDPGIVEDARRLALRYIPKDGEVINRIKVRGSNQIQIRVRFAEVSRNVDKIFGIDWENVGNAGGFAFGLMSGNAPAVVATGANLLNVTRPVTGTNTNDVISLAHNGGRWNINSLIDALESDGLVTVLAEPNLTAMSGETASFLAGGEFPIPVPQSLGSITIDWKTYGVMLAFTPTLIGEDRISLHVRPEVSQLSEAGAITVDNISVPALTTRRAETTIELSSGQSFAIAGLLNNNQTQSANKYPFLGDMPILGPLFRSTQFQNNETELVIIITPYIVKPANEEQLALPTDGFSPPSDVDRLFQNRTTNSDPNARTMSGAPRAVQAEPPLASAPVSSLEEAPAPAASPVSAVSSEGAPVAPKPLSGEGGSVQMSLPVPAAPPEPVKHAEPAGPAGPGGFILE